MDNVQAKPKYDCGPPDAPVITLDTRSKYRQDDARRATIDEEAEALLGSKHPVVSSGTGGNTTLLFHNKD
jgi:hypothetical protein